MTSKEEQQKKKEYDALRYLQNKDIVKQSRKERYAKNKEQELNKIHEYYVNNKDTIKETKKIYVRDRRKNDVSFGLRSLVSNSINKTLKKQGSSKDGNSILDFLPYSISELKEHLEKQFEPWMTWANQGKYNFETWDDNDPTTWKWNIDHIVPHSTFHYTSMEDQAFKDCWALTNLRPLSAKQNLIDGDRR